MRSAYERRCSNPKLKTKRLTFEDELSPEKRLSFEERYLKRECSLETAPTSICPIQAAASVVLFLSMNQRVIHSKAASSEQQQQNDNCQNNFPSLQCSRLRAGRV